MRGDSRVKGDGEGTEQGEGEQEEEVGCSDFGHDDGGSV